jgi:hypothetical protein
VCLEQEACRQQSAGVITANKSAGIASMQCAAYAAPAEALLCVAQALKAAEEAEKEWEADSPDARKEALVYAQNAADFAQQTYKHLRLVHN